MPHDAGAHESLQCSDRDDDMDDLGYGGGGASYSDDDDEEEGGGWGMRRSSEKLWDDLGKKFQGDR